MIVIEHWLLRSLNILRYPKHHSTEILFNCWTFCLPGWVYIGSHAYCLTHKQVLFGNASALCQNANSQLLHGTVSPALLANIGEKLGLLKDTQLAFWTNMTGKVCYKTRQTAILFSNLGIYLFHTAGSLWLWTANYTSFIIWPSAKGCNKLRTLDSKQMKCVTRHVVYVNGRLKYGYKPRP